ncbi:amino acid permease [Candidatus Woesearchaeota archaeon]|nr:amino acid permease [Candidatus Woesearchaeota archaeon]
MYELKRGFGYWTILCLSIGSIIGTAIFFGPSIGARYSGNLSMVAWVILSLISIYIAMCFSELVSMFPKSGGVYEYSKQAYGRFMSFMIGWTAWLVGNLSVVVMIVAAINLLIPDSLTTTKFLLSLILIVMLNLIAYVGIEATSFIMICFAVVMVAVLAALIGKGSFNVAAANFVPLATHGFATVFTSMFFLMEAYFGWEAATYLAEETKDPRRTIPRAIVNGTVVIALLGAGIIFVSLGVFGYEALASMSSPTKALAQVLFGSAGEGIIIAGIFITLLGSAASGIVTIPRLTLALARDKLQFGRLSEIHPKFKTPYKAIMFQAAITMLILLLGFGQYEVLLSILIPLAIIMYIPIILTVPILRLKDPHVERLYRVPFGKIGPVLVAVALLAAIIIGTLTTQNGPTLLKLSISLILMGIPLYFLIEIYYDPQMITEINDLFSYLSFFTERFSYPKGLRKEIMSFLGDLYGKTVIEFGCGVGTLTTSLLRAVGPDGAVYATHFSKNDLKITMKRIEKERWETEGRVYGEARLIHDPEQFYRLHPDVHRADVVVSVGMLGYMHDMQRILKDMYRVLSPDARICFVEYSDFFHLLPSLEWLADDARIEQVFRQAGFSVRVTRKKSFLWDRIFIYGFKLKGIVVI